ncbi:hypothetical protein [Photobacterium leiognathi]|uniref:hypothetical protein n=1 Tax=Photobacterium leiognathi TaxID=553611 RepID=UPI0029823B34|nr:hypothetical protein [Photobacterium leiognathi]
MQFELNSPYNLSDIPESDTSKGIFFATESNSILTIFLSNPSIDELEAFDGDSYIFALNVTTIGGVLYFAVLNAEKDISMLMETSINIRSELDLGKPIHFPCNSNERHTFSVLVVDTISGIIKNIKDVAVPYELTEQIKAIGLKQCSGSITNTDVERENNKLVEQFPDLETAFQSLNIHTQKMY